MKREEIKSLLENGDLDIDAKLKAIMDLNGKDLTELKASNKALEDKVKEGESLQSQLENANKELETYKAFEEKAKKYDSIYPEYEKMQNDAKIQRLQASAKNSGIKDEFIEFACSKVGEVEDYDTAFKKFAEEHPQFVQEKIEKVVTNPELNKTSVSDEFADFRNLK